MFRQLNGRVNRESGMVLVTVLMIVAVMMILCVSILSQNITQNTSSQAQVEQIRADQYAKGVFWNAYSSGVFTPGSTVLGNSAGKTYTATVSPQAGNAYAVSVSY